MFVFFWKCLKNPKQPTLATTIAYFTTTTSVDQALCMLYFTEFDSGNLFSDFPCKLAQSAIQDKTEWY